MRRDTHEEDDLQDFPNEGDYAPLGDGDVNVNMYDNGNTKAVNIKRPQEEKVNVSENPYRKWIFLARAFDAWRPFPRAFILMYMYIVYQVITWYISLPDPTMEQSGLISVVVGAGAAWFGLYVGSGGKGPSE